MQQISDNGAYQIWSSFGPSIVEGTMPGASAGNGANIEFSITQTNPTYNTFYWRIEPLTGQTADFWNPKSNIIGGAPATSFDISGFGTSAGVFPFKLTLNADNILEQNEQFSIAFYVNVTDSAFSMSAIARATFTIVDDDTSGPRSVIVFRDGVTSAEAPTAYSGPVSYLRNQFLGTATGEVATSTDDNDFLNLLGGDDAANAAGGNDVLDGGTGSNFLSGGAGWDVFFLDGRGGTTTWSTITDWQPTEQLSVWGWRPGVSRVTWVDSAGAPGWTGITMHADLDGNGRIDTSVTWTGLTRPALPAPREFEGLLWFL